MSGSSPHVGTSLRQLCYGGVSPRVAIPGVRQLAAKEQALIEHLWIVCSPWMLEDIFPGLIAYVGDCDHVYEMTRRFGKPCFEVLIDRSVRLPSECGAGLR